MLAKHDMAIKASRTIRSIEAIMLDRCIISTRSILVLLSATEIVKPPASSVMVGENLAESMRLVASVNDVLGWRFFDTLGCIECRRWHRVFAIQANEPEDDQEEW